MENGSEDRGYKKKGEYRERQEGGKAGKGGRKRNKPGLGGSPQHSEPGLFP